MGSNPELHQSDSISQGIPNTNGNPSVTGGRVQVMVALSSTYSVEFHR